MKNIISLLVLICSVAVIIVSCAKKSDTSSTSTDTSASGSSTTDNTTIGTGTGTTASGTVTGDDNLTGIFNSSYWGQEPSGGCIDNSTAVTALSSSIPSGTLGFKKQIIITSSTTFTSSMQYYSDASCATITGHMNMLYKDFAVGDSLSGLTAGSSPAKPTTAKKVSYTEQSLAINCNTDICTTFFNSTFGASNLATLGYSQGTELVVTANDSEVNIWATGTMSGSSKAYLYTGSSAESTYPTDWSSGGNTMWQE